MLFYEIKTNYYRQTGEENPSYAKETYLVEGITPADVEKRLMEEIKPLIFGDCELPSCKKVQLYDIIENGNSGSIFYKARVEMITVNDDGSESRNKVSILLAADSINDAMHALNDYLELLDCEIVSIARSQIIEVFRAVK